MSSREYRGRRVVLWPVNIDATASIREGRKVPRASAPSRPTIDEIVRAARELGLDPIVEEKAYPRSWNTERRRVAVLKRGSKRQTLIMLAEAVKRLRSRQKTHR